MKKLLVFLTFLVSSLSYAQNMETVYQQIIDQKLNEMGLLTPEEYKKTSVELKRYMLRSGTTAPKFCFNDNCFLRSYVGSQAFNAPFKFTSTSSMLEVRDGSPSFPYLFYPSFTGIKDIPFQQFPLLRLYSNPNTGVEYDFIKKIPNLYNAGPGQFCYHSRCKDYGIAPADLSYTFSHYLWEPNIGSTLFIACKDIFDCITAFDQYQAIKTGYSDITAYRYEDAKLINQGSRYSYQTTLTFIRYTVPVSNSYRVDFDVNFSKIEKYAYEYREKIRALDMAKEKVTRDQFVPMFMKMWLAAGFDPLYKGVKITSTSVNTDNIPKLILLSEVLSDLVIQIECQRPYVLDNGYCKCFRPHVEVDGVCKDRQALEPPVLGTLNPIDLTAASNSYVPPSASSGTGGTGGVGGGSIAWLGPDPNVQSPALETSKTTEDILAPVFKFFPTLKNYSVVKPLTTKCEPILTEPVWGKVFAFNSHCDFSQQNASTIGLMSVMLYMIYALFIVLSA